MQSWRWSESETCTDQYCVHIKIICHKKYFRSSTTDICLIFFYLFFFKCKMSYATPAGCAVELANLTRCLQGRHGVTWTHIHKVVLLGWHRECPAPPLRPVGERKSHPENSLIFRFLNAPPFTCQLARKGWSCFIEMAQVWSFVFQYFWH